MLTCNMDVEERSVWLRATPGAAAMAQPFYCTEPATFTAAPTLPQPAPTRIAISCFTPCPAAV